MNDRLNSYPVLRLSNACVAREDGEVVLAQFANTVAGYMANFPKFSFYQYPFVRIELFIEGLIREIGRDLDPENTIWGMWLTTKRENENMGLARKNIFRGFLNLAEMGYSHMISFANDPRSKRLVEKLDAKFYEPVPLKTIKIGEEYPFTKYDTILHPVVLNLQTSKPLLIKYLNAIERAEQMSAKL